MRYLVLASTVLIVGACGGAGASAVAFSSDQNGGNVVITTAGKYSYNFSSPGGCAFGQNTGVTPTLTASDGSQVTLVGSVAPAAVDNQDTTSSSGSVELKTDTWSIKFLAPTLGTYQSNLAACAWKLTLTPES